MASPLCIRQHRECLNFAIFPWNVLSYSNQGGMPKPSQKDQDSSKVKEDECDEIDWSDNYFVDPWLPPNFNQPPTVNSDISLTFPTYFRPNDTLQSLQQGIGYPFPQAYVPPFNGIPPVPPTFNVPPPTPHTPFLPLTPYNFNPVNVLQGSGLSSSRQTNSFAAAGSAQLENPFSEPKKRPPTSEQPTLENRQPKKP